MFWFGFCWLVLNHCFWIGDGEHPRAGSVIIVAETI